MKSNQVVEVTIGEGKLTFQVVGVEEVLILDLGKVSEKNLEYAALHGFRQRVSGAAAIPCDPETGKSATPQEKYAAMKRLVEHFNSGAEEWSPARVEGGGGRRVNYLAKALAELKGLPLEVTSEFVKRLKAGEKAALELQPEVKELIDKKRAENVKADGGELIERLMQRRPVSL